MCSAPRLDLVVQLLFDSSSVSERRGLSIHTDRSGCRYPLLGALQLVLDLALS